MEKMLLEATSGASVTIPDSIKLYSQDIDKAKLETQIKLLPQFVQATDEGIKDVWSMKTTVIALNYCQVRKKILSEHLAILLQIYFTIPVTTATAERSLSVLRGQKTCLRSWMCQERLNDPWSRHDWGAQEYYWLPFSPSNCRGIYVHEWQKEVILWKLQVLIMNSYRNTWCICIFVTTDSDWVSDGFLLSTTWTIKLWIWPSSKYVPPFQPKEINESYSCNLTQSGPPNIFSLPPPFKSWHAFSFHMRKCDALVDLRDIYKGVFGNQTRKLKSNADGDLVITVNKRVYFQTCQSHCMLLISTS